MPDQAGYKKLQQLMENDPEQFRALMLSLEKTRIKPHAGQAIVLRSKARFKVMNCGRRWGKTVLAAHMILKAARQPNKMLWWVAPTYRITKRGYEQVLKQMPPDVLMHTPPPSTNFDAGRPIILRFKNGTIMEFYSAERPEGMLGAGVDFVVLDEAARMRRDVWEQTISPTLMDNLGGCLIISTPRGRNWFWQVWNKGQDAADELWDSWTFTTQDNPTLPPGEADRMAADMPVMEADQEIYAKFLAAGSSVFWIHEKALQHAAVRDDNLVEDCPPEGPVYLGIDLGRTNDATVLYGTRERDRRNVYYERWQGVQWAEQRRRIRRAVKRLEAAGAEHVTLMVDEGNAGSVIVEDLEEQGYDVVGINFTTNKGPMVRLLANDLERARAFVLADEGIDEFEAYGMNMTPTGRIQYSAPEGQHDDVVSAKMLSHWGCVNEGMAGATMLSLTDDAPAPRPDDQTDGTEDDLDGGDWSDLVDDDREMSDEEAMMAIGFEPMPPQRMNQIAALGFQSQPV